ncbi:tyrosine-type recombinase/integrase [Mucisphaera sp.]|uniref:tyrosine-type recombinase/integrase n=1 Tax=Mucisphaera sp. TaxID=2913024 RepID=UPI003D09B1EE
MATLYASKKTDSWSIQFADSEGIRRTITLGKITDKQATGIKLLVEDLINAKASGGSPKPLTLRRLSELSVQLRNRIAAVGLCEPVGTAKLGEFIQTYCSERQDVEEATQATYRRAEKHLLAFFGSQRSLRSITPAEAEAFSIALKVKQGLAENTACRMVGRARQFFSAACKRKLIDENPFEGLKATVQGNPERQRFITQADAQRVLDACPGPEWRLLFALGRYGGLRIPSEIQNLRWSDVDWERKRIRITSPKTRKQGKGARDLPIFPQLETHLREAFEAAPEGAEFLIPTQIGDNKNPSTHLRRIVRRAGLTPWPKLWHNLRSTRQTELMQVHPVHVVAQWLGNTVAVAVKHYAQVTDAHYEAAVSGCSALQNPMQQVSAQRGTSQNSESLNTADDPRNVVVHRDAVVCTLENIGQVGGTGLEPATSSV